MLPEIQEPGQEKRQRCTCPVGKWVFCFSCCTFNSTCPLDWKNKHGLWLVQKSVQRNYDLNVYLSFSRLSHRQSNLSRMSGHCIFCTLRAQVLFHLNLHLPCGADWQVSLFFLLSLAQMDLQAEAIQALNPVTLAEYVGKSLTGLVSVTFGVRMFQQCLRWKLNMKMLLIMSGLWFTPTDLAWGCSMIQWWCWSPVLWTLWIVFFTERLSSHMTTHKAYKCVVTGCGKVCTTRLGLL